MIDCKEPHEGSYYLFSKRVNWCQGDGFSSVGTQTGAIKLAMAGPLGIFSVLDCLIQSFDWSDVRTFINFRAVLHVNNSFIHHI